MKDFVITNSQYPKKSSKFDCRGCSKSFNNKESKTNHESSCSLLQEYRQEIDALQLVRKIMLSNIPYCLQCEQSDIKKRDEHKKTCLAYIMKYTSLYCADINNAHLISNPSS